MSLLKNKIAVITGGGSGIGLATAERFVEEGAYVFIAGRRQAERDNAVAAIGTNITAAKGRLRCRNVQGREVLARAAERQTRAQRPEN